MSVAIPKLSFSGDAIDFELEFVPLSTPSPLEPGDNVVLIQARERSHRTIIRPAGTCIQIEWESRSVLGLSLHYVGSSNSMFIGAGNLMACVDLSSGTVVFSKERCIVWSLDRHRDRFVLESGELEVALYDLHGQLVSEAQVEPPWSSERHDHGIKFLSPTSFFQESWLLYPAASALDTTG